MVKIKDIKKWLSDYLRVDEKELIDIIKPDNALSFLIVWSIFESKCFNSYVRLNDFDNFICHNMQKINSEDLNDATCHFHERYQKDSLYRRLKRNNNDNYIDEIISKQYLDLSEYEKMKLVLYVIYRYRNNLFHGNKNIIYWGEYKEQFRHCINCIIDFIDKKCSL